MGNPLALWLDFSDRNTLYDATSGGSLVADGGAIARLEDKSGNGFHATQATLNNRPLVGAGLINGRSVGVFDGTNDALVLSGGALDIFRNKSQGYIFAVISSSTATSGGVIRALTNLGGHRFGMDIVTTSVTAYGRRLDNDLFITASIARPSGLILAASQANWSSGNVSAEVNGVIGTPTNYSSGAGNSSDTESNAFVIGSGIISGFFLGNICEIVVCNSPLTADQITSLRNYLNAKWAVY